MKAGIFRRVASILVLSLVLSSIGRSSATAHAAGEFTAGHILVKFRPDTPGQVIADVHGQNGGVVQAVIPGIDVQVVGVPAGQEVRRVAAYLGNPYVLFAEVNGFYYALTNGTNDPLVGRQWQYNNRGQTGGTRDADIDAFEAWHVTMGSESAAIAILDTGIDQEHEDLSSKIVKNANFTNSPTVDDLVGHGTHVAGIAAAISDNGIGVAGTCPKCVLYNVKVIEDAGFAGSWSGIANGVVWAADNGASVINMSFGASSGSSTIQLAVDYAWGKGVVLTGAAGNSGSSSEMYPAAYTNVIAVAATDHNDVKADFSNYGAGWVDVAAPGANILSTVAPDSLLGLGEKYVALWGTSQAAPHAAGVAGLVWSTSLCAAGDNACVRRRIESGADPVTGTGTFWAHGRINAQNSVTSAVRP